MQKIPVVILCGGEGTRMRGSTATKKELVEVGGRPILWHVMRIFSAYGFHNFVLTLGYRAEDIKRYFLEYETLSRDFTVELGNGRSTPQLHGQANHPNWQVTLVDTGLHTEKATRIAQIRPHLLGDRFFVAYGDDVSDIDLDALLKFHQSHGKLATITAVQVNLPYGIVEAEADGLATGFVERPKLPYWINGGFMLFEAAVLDKMADGDNVSLETEILPQLAQQQQLMIYRHGGFWQSMNTLKDTMFLESIWRDNPPWKVWTEE